MGIEPVDRRVRKTRRQLRECLITLLKEKKVQDITVRELTDMADLNRGTFYLHYKDVFDLLEKTEAELQEDFNQLVCKHDAVDLKQRPSVIFNEIYSLVMLLLPLTEEAAFSLCGIPFVWPQRWFFLCHGWMMFCFSHPASIFCLSSSKDSRPLRAS